MNKTGFDIYSGIKVENTNEKSPKFDDIDSKSLEDQEKIRYSQDTKFRRHLTMGNDNYSIMVIYGLPIIV